MRKKSPPYWLDWLLDKILSGEQAEIIKGDLLELYKEKAIKHGSTWASFNYFVDVLSLLRIKIFRRNRYKTLNKMDLFFYNWKITWRVLIRDRFTSSINILGLSIGFASVLLAWIYIEHENKYDKFIVNPKTTVRVSSHWAQIGNYAKTPFPVGPALLDEYSYVDDFFRCVKITTDDGSGIPVRIGDRKFFEEKMISVDKSFIEIFNIQFLWGDPKSALTDPLSLVLSQRAAKKYFGSENPIGEVMNIEGKYDMVVTGIVENIHNKSHLEFDILSPMAFMIDIRWKQWDGFDHDWTSPLVWTYARLKDEKSVIQLEKDIATFVVDRYPEGIIDDNDNFHHYVQRVSDIHLKSNIGREFKANGNQTMLVVFGTVSLLILFIASINFINLTTARSTIRAKEVGVKKVVGAEKTQLIRQFYFEVFVQNLLAVIVAYLVLFLIWQPFGHIMSVDIPLDRSTALSTVLISVFLCFINTLIAGTYPAIFLTSFKPTAILKGKLLAIGRGLSLRRILVTMQFVAAMVFIASALIISDQLDFIRNKDIGVNTSQLVEVNRPPRSISNEVIIEAFRSHPNVISATASAGSLPGKTSPSWSYHPQGFPKERQSFNTIWTYDDFAKVFGGEIIAGEDFSRKFRGDSLNAVLLNETLARSLGWSPEEAIGKSFDEFEWRKQETNPGRVVGVVKDFNFRSLHHEIDPAVMLYTDSDFGNIILRLSGEDLVGTIKALETSWDELMPDVPFTCKFMDESIEMQYQKETKLSTSMGYFTSLSLFITILGLIGLVSFMLTQRTKEISIRKVLGAGVMQIIFLVSADFVKIIAIAFVIASAVSYFMMERWLQDFSFRITVGILPFLAAGLLAFLIIAILLGLKSVELSKINPASTLKDE